MACIAPVTVDGQTGGQIGLYPDDPAGKKALFNGKPPGYALKYIIGATAIALIACSTASYAQTGTAATQTMSTAQEQSSPATGTAPAGAGLSDLDAMTFGCVKAGLNAAAREAAKVPAQGTYQFSYFKIIDDSHQSSYEIHFKSNYEEEADLKYCVAIYCQQGWDPETTETLVRLMNKEHPPMGVAAHEAACGNEHAPAERQLQQ